MTVRCSACESKSPSSPANEGVIRSVLARCGADGSFCTSFPKDFATRVTSRQSGTTSGPRICVGANRSAKKEFAALLRAGRHDEIAARAVRIEQRSRYSMLFSFEKMALRDAVKSTSGAHTFAEGLFAFLHGREELQPRFEAWVSAVTKLPRKQTRVLTWPLVTVFGFIAQPGQHIFMKPNTLRAAARAYGFDLEYQSRPNWNTYSRLLELGARVRASSVTFARAT